MEEKQKKLLICLLLLISCVTSALLIIYIPVDQPKQLSGFEQADSLILATLYQFRIPEDQVKIQTVAMDSVYDRNIYLAAVPPSFVKTQFHFELSQAVSSFNVVAPARVIFPQHDMIIHMVHHQTVISTLVLQTDPDLAIQNQKPKSTPPSPSI